MVKKPGRRVLRHGLMADDGVAGPLKLRDVTHVSSGEAAAVHGYAKMNVSLRKIPYVFYRIFPATAACYHGRKGKRFDAREVAHAARTSDHLPRVHRAV